MAKSSKSNPGSATPRTGWLPSLLGAALLVISGFSLGLIVGIVKDELMVRVGADAYEECLAQPHAREMDFTGRAMKGMIYIGTEGFEDDADLEDWVARGLAFAQSLPPK
jgi:hypothetical protein